MTQNITAPQPQLPSWLDRLRAHTVTANSWCALLAHRPGQPTQVLGPGKHRVPRGTQTRLVDLRERSDVLAVQELPTAEGLGVRVTAAWTWRVVDPVAFTEVAQSPESELYAAVQFTLRDLVVGVSAEEAPTLLRGVREALTAGTRAAVARLGIEVLDVQVRDVVLPAELRRAQGEMLLAKYRGAAKLEEARSETAALRSLANGAKLLAENPALAQLRLVQSLPVGTTLELRPRSE